MLMDELRKYIIVGNIETIMWLHSSVGIAEVTGSNAIEAMIFSGFYFPVA